MSIRGTSLVLNFAVPGILAFICTRLAGGGGLWWWLFYVNIQELMLLAKDKLAAVKKWGRTPESTLLIMALAGASPALLGGRFLFKHKTSKESFIVPMVGVVVVQAVLLWWLWPQAKHLF